MRERIEQLAWVTSAETSEIPEGFHAALHIGINGETYIDLSLVPENSRLQLTFEDATPHPRPIHIRGLKREAFVSLIRTNVQPAPEKVDIHLDVGTEGNVAITSEAPAHLLTVGAERNYTGQIEILSGMVTLANDLPEETPVLLNGGHLSLVASRQNLRVSGKSAITTSGGSPIRIDRLTIHERVDLKFTSNTPPIVANLVGDVPKSSLMITDIPGNSWTWQVENISALAIAIEKPVRIPSRSADRIQISGPISIEFGANSTASDLTFTPNEAGTPKLVALTGSVIDNLSGTVALGPVSGCVLTGSNDGFDITQVTSAMTDPALRSSVLTGFRIPGQLPGRHILASMSDVYYLDPDTRSLPGSEHGWHKQLCRWWSYKQDNESKQRDAMRELRQNIEVLRELQRLVIEKGSPGSTRTKVAWNSYRLRHRGTTSRVEYLSLAAYRLVGYGERPMPAFTTWLVTAACTAGLRLGLHPDLSPDGILLFLRETVHQAIGPLTGLLYAGNSSLNSPWDYLARAVVAVPLATGLFAFRNYVKSRQG
ncbi:hypothetical protein ACXJJ3_12880 [Kribbella sp. WER1]